MLPGLNKYSLRQQEIIDRAARDPVVADLFAHVLAPAADQLRADLQTASLGTQEGVASAIRMQGSLDVFTGLQSSFNLSLKR